MSFDRSDIRPAMDVYTYDNVYLGTVIDVVSGPAKRSDEHTREQESTSSTISGELLGPMPTQTLGNPGPVTQAAAKHFASDPDAAERLGRGLIVVGKWWGLVGKRMFPFDAIQTVSMERVVLKRGA